MQILTDSQFDWQVNHFLPIAFLQFFTLSMLKASSDFFALKKRNSHNLKITVNSRLASFAEHPNSEKVPYLSTFHAVKTIVCKGQLQIFCEKGCR